MPGDPNSHNLNSGDNKNDGTQYPNVIRKSDISIFNKVVPTYKGDLPSLKIFIKRCEAFLATIDDVYENEFLDSLVYKLMGKAFRIYNDKKFITWTGLKKALISGIDEGKSLTVLQNEMINLRQVRGQTVQDFADVVRTKLDELDERIQATHSDIDVRRGFRDEHSKVAIRTFKEGVLGPLRHRLIAYSANTFDDVVRFAIEESQYKGGLQN